MKIAFILNVIFFIGTVVSYFFLPYTDIVDERMSTLATLVCLASLYIMQSIQYIALLQKNRRLYSRLTIICSVIVCVALLATIAQTATLVVTLEYVTDMHAYDTQIFLFSIIIVIHTLGNRWLGRVLKRHSQENAKSQPQSI